MEILYSMNSFHSCIKVDNYSFHAVLQQTKLIDPVSLQEKKIYPKKKKKICSILIGLCEN